jgi:N-formylglutamate amidohydrolase
VILHVPHGSRRIPGSVRQDLLLDDQELAAELDRMTDAHTGAIAAGAARRARHTPWIFENLLSRLVVDPERFLDEREEMRAVGMGAVYTATSHGRPLRDDRLAAQLVDAYFHPYARAVTDLVAERLAATGRAVLVDVHSYPDRPLPYELHADGARPAICLGTDAFHTPPALVDAAREAFADCGDVALNTPFAGCYIPDTYYGTAAEVTGLMVEIRRAPDGEPSAGLEAVTNGLAALIDYQPKF